jgi:Flp pilus assembly protein TadB
LLVETTWLVIIAIMLVGGAILRIWQHRLAPVDLHKVSAHAASQLVAEFLQSCYDGQFGFPSGLFRIEQADDKQVVATEIVSRGSHFTQILSGLYRAVLSISGCFGCVGSIVALFLAAMVTPLLLYAALTEIVLRYLLRSRIVADLTPAGDGTTVSFTLRGPVALLVGRRLQHAFHPPILPARVAGLAGIPAQGEAR